jgi:hypothetical protein
MDSEVVGSAEISALIVHSCSHAVAARPRWVFRGYPFVMIFLAVVIPGRWVIVDREFVQADER